MDLIYTNANGEDLGVLFDYNFDLAFGKDENNFELTLDLSQHCCEHGSMIYFEGTEYGGIIDSIKVETENRNVVYSGRTWHGILDSKTIQPEANQDYFVVNGEANAVLQQIIEHIGLDDLFSASDEDSGINIVDYKFRYKSAYVGILKMLIEFGGKPKFEHRTNEIILSAVPYADYSKSEEWDDSQLDFVIQKNYRTVNHLICLGSGNLKDRHVIHLFADENGGIQPYLLDEEKTPVEDSDYILDCRNQIFFDTDEISDVYDYSNAETAVNYVKLEEQPSDWSENYASYFKKNTSGEYDSIQHTIQKDYTALTEQPSDWTTAFANYFYQDSSGNYKSVDGIAQTIHTILIEKPSDWQYQYSRYYTYGGNDGTGAIWNSVQGVNEAYYVKQSQCPTDWRTNYKSYYVKSWGGGYRNVDSDWYYNEKWEEWIESVPAWSANRFYTMKTKKVCPTFEKNKYYVDTGETMSPVFDSGEYLYFSCEESIVKPSFVAGKTYRKTYDNFADLVSNSVECFKELIEIETIDIDLSLAETYDVGDVVGARENTTGLSVWQNITKKIVSINEKIETISYEIGVV